MPELNVGVRDAYKQAHSSVSPEAIKVGSVPVARVESHGHDKAEIQEQSISTNNTVPERQNDTELLPDMPASHAHYDPTTITKSGLLKACPYFIEAAKKNPSFADAQAERVVRSKKEEAAMRQKGMDSKTIQSQKWASMRERHKAKTETEQKPEPVKSEHQQTIEAELKTSVRTDDANRHHHQTPVVEERETQANKTLSSSSPMTESGRIIESNAVRLSAERTNLHIPEQEFRVHADEISVTSSEESNSKAGETGTNTLVLLEVTDASIIPQNAQLELQSDTFVLEEGHDETGLDEISQLVTDEFEIEVSLAPAHLKTSTDEQLELEFDPETIDTYKELVALTAEELEPVAFENPQKTFAAEVSETVRRLTSSMQTDEIPDFELFIAKQSPTKELMTSEYIYERANEQPLEEALAQLVELLSEGRSMIEFNELPKIVRAIEAALPDCYPVQEDKKPATRITPELTNKLLMLLQLLGYEQPREALTNFASRYGLIFLLQALTHLAQLNHVDNRREFFTQLPARVQLGDDHRSQLRKVLSRLAVDQVSVRSRSELFAASMSA